MEDIQLAGKNAKAVSATLAKPANNHITRRRTCPPFFVLCKYRLERSGARAKAQGETGSRRYPWVRRNSLLFTLLLTQR
jgi:hypothetical protein